ncbi:MAG: sugar phosphate isomerase/epimerase [Limnochordia bacterium]|nr:sugar phosphate isomerase/epimerase [Limnochordia bacterium]MDD2630058.1 sugar phosphate isomerase/epimerase [Limnochordia bacterium]
MKLAVMLMSFEQELKSNEMTVFDVIDCCVELGLHGIEFSNREIAQIPEQQLRSHLEQAGLELAMYIIITDFVSLNQDVLAQTVSEVNREIDKGHRLGARQVLLVPGNPKPGILDEEGREAIARGLQDCASYGKMRGIKVTNENFGAHATFRGRIEQMEEFLRKAPDSWFTYDDGNFLLAGQDPLNALECLSSRMVHVHLKDWIIVDDPLVGVFPMAHRPGYFYKEAIVGEGVVPTTEIVAALKKMEFPGFLSIEHGGTIPGKEGLARAVAYLRPLMGS